MGMIYRAGSVNPEWVDDSSTDPRALLNKTFEKLRWAKDKAWDAGLRSGNAVKLKREIEEREKELKVLKDKLPGAENMDAELALQQAKYKKEVAELERTVEELKAGVEAWKAAQEANAKASKEAKAAAEREANFQRMREQSERRELERQRIEAEERAEIERIRALGREAMKSARKDARQ